MNGKISKRIEGKFNVVSKIGKPIPISLLSVKNFSSSNIFIINIRDENTNVIKKNLVKKTL